MKLCIPSSSASFFIARIIAAARTLSWYAKLSSKQTGGFSVQSMSMSAMRTAIYAMSCVPPERKSTGRRSPSVAVKEIFMPALTPKSEYFLSVIISMSRVAKSPRRGEISARRFSDALCSARSAM